jgi:hypothetical protein
MASEAGLSANALLVLRCVADRYSSISTIGGVRPGSGTSDHYTGHAVDIMTYSATSLGWEIAYWLQDSWQRFGITYIIFDAKIWSVQRSSEGWRNYESCCDATQAHLDHVHVSVS